jgi:MFS family permease
MRPPVLPGSRMTPGLTGGVSLRRAFGAFHNRQFSWLWGSTLASFASMQMQLIARGVLAWELSHSYAIVGVVEASFALPMAIFSLPGGAAADRIEKRGVVMISQGTMGVLALVTAVLIQSHFITIPLLFVIGVIQGGLFSINGPARMALLTEIVDDRELTAAIALQNIAMNATRIIGPTVAAILIATVGIHGAYYASGVFYLFTVIAMTQIARTVGHLNVVRQTIPREIGDGIRYVFTNHTLRSLMISGFMLTLFIMPYRILLPGFADHMGRPELYGLMMTVTGIGGLIGSLLVAALTEHPRKPLLQLLIGLVSAVGLVGLGILSRPFGIAGALTALVVIGIGSTAYMTLNQTMLMAESDHRYHGRVMSIFMQTFSAMPLMSLPLGFLADGIGAANLFVIQGVVVAIALTALALAIPGFTFRVETPRVEGDDDDADGPAPPGARALEYTGARDDAAGAGG